MKVAVWVMQMRVPDVILTDSEEDAISWIRGIEQTGNAAVSGVQFEDGRTIRESEFETEWKAYIESLNTGLPEAVSFPVKVTREVIDPFSWSVSNPRMAKIDVDLPAWVGKN